MKPPKLLGSHNETCVTKVTRMYKSGDVVHLRHRRGERAESLHHESAGVRLDALQVSGVLRLAARRHEPLDATSQPQATSGQRDDEPRRLLVAERCEQGVVH